MGRILIGGEGGVTTSLSVLMRADGLVVQEAALPESVIQGVAADLCDIVIVDIGVAQGQGIDLIARCAETDPDIPVIAVAHQGTVEEALSACEQGACDYLTAPINPKKFTQTLHRWLDQEGAGSGSQSSVVRLQHDFQLGSIIAESASMNAVCERVRRIGPAEVPVCILGPEGSGRAAVARALHEESSRTGEFYQTIHCAEGHTQALFSNGAGGKKKRGEKPLVVQANRGTLYFRDVDCLPEDLQRQILGLMNEREATLHDGEVVPLDVRCIFSFSRSLVEVRDQGMLSPEFLKRISILTIQMPEISERQQDILPLISMLLAEADGPKNSIEYTMSSVGAEMLERYNWPGGHSQFMKVVNGHIIPNREQFISADILPEEVFDQSALEAPINESKGPHAYRNLLEFLHHYEEETMDRLRRIKVDT